MDPGNKSNKVKYFQNHRKEDDMKRTPKERKQRV